MCNKLVAAPPVPAVLVSCTVDDPLLSDKQDTLSFVIVVTMFTITFIIIMTPHSCLVGKHQIVNTQFLI